MGLSSSHPQGVCFLKLGFWKAASMVWTTNEHNLLAGWLRLFATLCWYLSWDLRAQISSGGHAGSKQQPVFCKVRGPNSIEFKSSKQSRVSAWGLPKVLIAVKSSNLQCESWQRTASRWGFCHAPIDKGWHAKQTHQVHFWILFPKTQCLVEWHSFVSRSQSFSASSPWTKQLPAPFTG